MPNAKEIRGRMKSISDTRKITNAMYMIASTKMRKAKNELDMTRPYFEALRTEISRVFIVNGRVKSRYFTSADAQEPVKSGCGCLVITADKGLAGAYNQNVLKEAMAFYRQAPDTKFFVVGEYGRHFFAHNRIPVEKAFLYTAQNPTLRRAREISTILLDLYEKNEISDLILIYTDLRSGISGEVRREKLLPFKKSHFLREEAIQAVETGETYEFFPDMEAVLDNCTRNYVPGYIYSALIDSFCSEQSARMEAMSAANDNAQKILDRLALQYNRARQAAITQEITEVTAGAKAHRRKKQKKSEEKGSALIDER